MKKIIILILVFSGTIAYSQKSKVIKIESIGISDKPLYDLIISVNKIEEPTNCCGITSNFIVNKKIFKRIKKFIFQKNTAINLIQNKSYEFGCYQISVNSKKKILYMLDSRKKAILYLKDLINELENIGNCEKIISDLEKILKRIDF